MDHQQEIDLYKLSSYFYDLPEELIAQHPKVPRDSSRLMVVSRATGEIGEVPFYELPHLLSSFDRLILNDTEVIPARLKGVRKTGGVAEIFLLEEVHKGCWKVLAKPAKKMKRGDQIFFSDHFSCTVEEEHLEGVRIVQFQYTGDFDALLQKHGEMPLPPYIHRKEKGQEDASCYQTLFASKKGAVAAPTAGLHFTEELFVNLEKKGVGRTHITLHVGLGTFRPVQVEDIREHKMHSERVIITDSAAQEINASKGRGRRIAVGTTCCRSLESAASPAGIAAPGEFSTDIFLYPGYSFRVVDAMITNFHLPGSTLLMLVSAFGGYELIREAYKKAVKEKYRFFSYGDAMIIL